MKYETNPPDAASLMMSARSFGNYDLPGALADLIDNSIKAGAREIALTCGFNGGNPEIRVRDDGHGLTGQELRDAMRPASSNPLAERSPDDLGRFGWGMKSASFSQCARLTVISRRDGELTGCVWNLADVDAWRMGVLDADEIAAMASPEVLAKDGVEVIWSDCDRLSENGTLTQAEFNALIVHAGNRLALIFHRYLSGEVRGRKLALQLNNRKIDGLDPFYRDHEATQQLEAEPLEIGGRNIDIQPFILPHYSKLLPNQYDQLGGEEGFLRNQGFYVYRNHRLIISGTWFRLLRHGELSQLVRVRVDIPNALDHIWKITIDKSDAQLPAALRNRMRQIVEGLRRRSSKVFRSRGGRLDRPGTTSVWSRYARGGEVRYAINREHPVIEALLEAGDDDHKQTATAALKVIEQAFPVAAFTQDASREACWATVAASKYAFDDRLDGLLVDHDEAEQARKAAVAAQKVDQDIDFDHVLVAMLGDTQPYLSFARSRRLLTPKSDAALKRLTRGDIRLPASERNALKYMVQKMVKDGFELPQAVKRGT